MSSRGWDQLRGLAPVVRAEAEEEVREDLRDALTLCLDLFQEGARVKTGRFRGSGDPYRGSPPVDEGRPAGQPFYAVPGHDAVDEVMSGWRPGEEVGMVDNAPYAEVLAARPDAHGTEGWIDVIAAKVAAR